MEAVHLVKTAMSLVTSQLEMKMKVLISKRWKRKVKILK